ncbi:MAG: FHA domain-containing protein [Chloroflexi bacterium]|nr:FHA domain-containing protein [Chloroflexota bacterium]
MKRLMLFVLLLVAFSAAQAQFDPRITVLTPATAEDDVISLSVRLEGIDPRQLGALSPLNFSIDEPFTDLSVTADPRLPMTLGVIINLSVNSEVGLIQRTLRAYFDSYFRDGDDVQFTVLTGVAPQNSTATTAAEIDALIDGLTVARGYFLVEDPLVAAAGALAESAADPTRVTQALFVTSFINDEDETRAADAFRSAGVPLNIVQVHSFREPFTEFLRRMASAANGIFVNNLTGSLVTDDTPQAIGALKVLYDALDASRTVFDITYRSTALDLTPEPQLTLSAQVGFNEVVSVPFSYERQFEAPVVEFANPSISAARRPRRADDGSVSYDVNSADVAVYVRFPDAVPRELSALQLEVTDAARGVVLQSRLEVDPQPASDGSYVIPWELADYDAPGTSSSVRVTVTVTDELGLTGSADQLATVAVAALPPLPTATPLPPTATFTPVPPTATLVPTAVPTAVPIVSVRSANTVLGQSSNDLVRAFAILAVALSGITAALLLRLRRVRRQLAYDQARIESLLDMPTPLPEDGSSPKMVAADSGDNGEVKPGVVVGRLIVKRGLPPQEVKIDKSEFTIGRKLADGIDYSIEAPFISPRHCVLQYRGGRFLLRDLGSKNGTFVNGERLAPERDVVVPNGSEVEITRNVVFELWDPDTVVNVDYQMDDVATERMSTRITTTVDTVSYPSALGIRAAADDDAEIGEDYSPV